MTRRRKERGRKKTWKEIMKMVNGRRRKNWKINKYWKERERERKEKERNNHDKQETEKKEKERKCKEIS